MEYTVFTLSVLYTIFLICHSVCTLIQHIPLSYSVCRVYSSFLTVHVQYILHFWQCMYGVHIYSIFLFLTVYVRYIPYFWQCMHGIFFTSDSVCTIYSLFLTVYTHSTSYSSFLTVYVRCIPHFRLYMYCILTIFLICDKIEAACDVFLVLDSSDAGSGVLSSAADPDSVGSVTFSWIRIRNYLFRFRIRPKGQNYDHKSFSLM